MAAQSCHVSDAESEYVELPAVPFARTPSWKGLIGGPAIRIGRMTGAREICPDI